MSKPSSHARSAAAKSSPAKRKAPNPATRTAPTRADQPAEDLEGSSQAVEREERSSERGSEERFADSTSVER